MSEYNCPECKDTGEYRGLNTVEPCRACGGNIYGISPLVLSAREGPAHQPQDESCPPQMEGLAVGHSVWVLIQGPAAIVACVTGMVIDRPLFGLPARCFLLSRADWGKDQRIIGRLECVSIEGDGDIVRIPSSAGEPVPFQLYRSAPCGGLSFTLLEDANA